MSLSTRFTKLPFFNRFIANLRVPLYREGYALVLSSALTSGLGMVYWVLVARNYTTTVVGLNSATMSAMFFLANVSQLDLVSALNRFIPEAGRKTGRLVIYAYLISSAIALGSSLLFVMGLNIWAPTLGFLKSSTFFIVWFVIATMTWCIFTLQDSVMIGLQQAKWVPIENVFFALAKIILVVALAKPFPQYGVFASWTIPLTASLLPVNILIFWCLIPKHIKETKDRVKSIIPAQILRFVTGNYLSSLIWMATNSLLPIIVIERAGATANAYYYLSWTIAYSLYLVSLNMGMSLITEAATKQKKIYAYSYRQFLQTARLLLPAVAIVMLGAPYILRLFGKSYAMEGVLLLRLLCLSAVPYMVNSFFICIARVQHRLVALVLVQASLCALVLSLSIILLDSIGIAGIGISWLLSQSIIAVFLLVTQLGKVWLPYLNTKILLRLLAVPRSILLPWQQRNIIVRNSELVHDILTRISTSVELPLPTTWNVQKVVKTFSDMTVFIMGPEGDKPAALLKLPQSKYAMMSMCRQKKVLAQLHADSRLGEWRVFLPTILTNDEIVGQPYVVEKMLPGLEARSVLSSPETRTRMQNAAVSAINELHRRTADLIEVDAHILRRWVDEPLTHLKRLVNKRPSPFRNEKAIDQLSTELHDTLTGQTLSISWIHGDFAPGNLLVTSDGATVTGIVDWDLAVSDGPPQLDVVWLLLSTRMVIQGKELGDVVREMLEGAKWTPTEQTLIDSARLTFSEDGLGLKTMIWLCWLRHMNGNFTKCTRYTSHWLWKAKNIDGVLCCV
jgi:O-antigen/teichoic acid export membrane protein